MLRRLLVVVVLAVIAAAVGGAWYGLSRSSGRTPSSAVLREVYGDAVIFDRVYQGQGSSEDNTRVVVLASQDVPSGVVVTLIERPGWRRLGQGAIRTSDGLCVVPYGSDEYLEEPQQGAEAVRAATDGQAAVVVSLSYC